MQVSFLKQGQTVSCGQQKGRFLRMSGSDALIELSNGTRVMWSGATEVAVLPEELEIVENVIPKLEAELARLEGFTVGKYAKLGILISTQCIELPRRLHLPLVHAALGEQPEDAIVCRRCPTKLCIRADHLFWGTRSDCQRDMLLRGVARPSGKEVTVLQVAAKIVKIRLRLNSLRALSSRGPRSDSLDSVSDI